jgi:DNA-binding NarL/FixJ family response regulator
MTPEDVARQLGMPLQQVRGVLHGQAIRVQGQGIKLTPAKRQEILDSLKKGLSLTEVAGQAGVSTSSVSKIAKESGVKLRTRPPIPQETRQKVADLLNEGVNKTEIGRRLGIDTSTVHTISAEYGFLKGHRYSRTVSKETVQSAIHLLELGVLPTHVAKQLGISHTTVGRIAHEHHIVLGGGILGKDVRQNITERLNRGQPPQEIARELNITPASVDRIRTRNLLTEALGDFVATMGADMTEAVQANLSRRMARASGSPAADTSTGGQTGVSAGTDAIGTSQKRPRVDPDEPEDVDEIIPPYVDELMDKLGPAQLPLMQNVWDDAVLLLDAEARHSPGSPQPGTSTGGASGPGGDPDPETASRRLDADVAAVVAALSDQDTDFLLHLSEDDDQNDA